MKVSVKLTRVSRNMEEATGDGKLLEVPVREGEIAKVGRQICVVDLAPAKCGS